MIRDARHFTLPLICLAFALVAVPRAFAAGPDWGSVPPKESGAGEGTPNGEPACRQELGPTASKP